MTAPQADDLRGRDAAIRVNQFRSSRRMFERNADEFLTFLDYLCAPTVAFSYSRVQQKWLWYDGMQEVARLLHNFVAAAKSLVDHTRVIYDQFYEPRGQFPEYRSKLAADFANDPLTRFVGGLREMAQHYRLPSIEEHTAMSGIVDGRVGTTIIQLRLKTADLRQYSGWKAPARVFLDGAGSHIDLRQLASAYRAHVLTLYEWFESRQREIHGIGPDLLRRVAEHGVTTGPRKEIEELAAGIAALEAIPREKRTYADLGRAFSPVLSIIDSRRLLLCMYDIHTWIDAALKSAQARFEIPADLARRIRSIP